MNRKMRKTVLLVGACLLCLLLLLTCLALGCFQVKGNFKCYCKRNFKIEYKMKKAVLFLAVLSLSFSALSCGGDDSGSGGGGTSTGTAPKVTSTTPANGATGIEVGEIVVTLTIDQAFTVSGTIAEKVTSSGATISNVAKSGNNLSFKATCNEYNKTVAITLAAGAIKSIGGIENAAYSFSYTTKEQQQTPTYDNDATALTKKLGWGWNLGNHFDTSSGEDGKHPEWGYWDKATPTAQLYTRLKEAGASTVRIGVTWGNYQNTTNWEIESAYMAEVKQNVDWAEAAGLNVIINMHHDEYWLDIKTAALNSTVNDNIKTRIAATWKQIATTFKDKGDFLFFETFNEIQDGNWGWGANLTDGGKQYNVLNEWNQTAVDAIRETGGNNATRWIGVPAYASSPSFALENSFKLPSDAANHIMVSVHFYDPNTFTLTPEDNGGKSEWGHTAASGKYQDGSNEEHVVDVFSKLQAKYIANNIPVYIGEYGCVMHTSNRSNQFREYYLEYVCRAAHEYGMPLCIWDNNSIGGGNEHHGYFNHNNGLYLNSLESLVKTMIKAATSDDASYTLESIYNKAPK